MKNISYNNKIKYIIIGLVWIASIAFYFSVLMRTDEHISADFVNHIKAGFSFISHLGKGISGIEEFKNTNQYSAMMSYPVWHFLVFIIYNIGHFIMPIISQQTLRLFSAAVVNATAITLTLIVLLKLFIKESDSRKLFYIKIGICASLLLVGPIDASLLLRKYYMGGYTGNPWHNPTYLVVRVVALLVFYMYVKLLQDKHPTKKQYIIAAITLLFSAFCKPNFYQVFLPGLVVFCIVFYIKNRNKESFIKCLWIALTCVPTALFMVGQFALSISGEGGRGIGIKFLYVWKHYTVNWALSLLVSIAFPLMVYIILFIRKRIDLQCLLALFVFLSALIQYMFFYIQIKPFAADFSWGLELSIFILFVVSMKKMIESIEVDNLKIRMFNMAAFGLYFIHLLYGMLYLVSIAYFLEVGRMFKILID